MQGERLNDGLSVTAVGDGPPLVTLPGLGQGADLVTRVPRSAAVPATALARGLGRTVHLVHRPVDPPAGMTVADLAGWHATALRERFGEAVDVMGTSAGGVTALQLALDHPGTVRRLVICAAASRVGTHGRQEMARMVALERDGRSVAGIASGLLAHGPLRLLLFAAFSLSRGRAREPGEAALVAAVQEWDVTDRLGELDLPVLVVGGGRDRLIPPDLVRATVEGIRDARLLLLAGRGHASVLFDRRVKPAIQGFLADS
ncbi:alpha/beta fold hydrolase [Actinophytocola oryzae]|uniref:alpha/beta fold hydrolase n=1 Tax=Actinophytocola oryzae TaxID=502181 RepID=UPI0014150D86|nr:alpha/beta fold hydrolase [Actinophytocola oryzae]